MSSQPIAGAAFGRHFVFALSGADLAQSPFPLPMPSKPPLPEPGQPMPPSPPPEPPSPVPFVNSSRKLPRLPGVAPASRLQVRAAPPMVSSGIAALDLLTGGLPRGCLSEICGPPSSGRTSLLLSALSAATGRQEICALVDTTDSLAMESAAALGLDLRKLLWIRCREADAQTSDAQKASRQASHANFSGNRNHGYRDYKNFARAVEQALRITDLLLQSGGFGLIVIDLADVPAKLARRIPLTSWFRFRRAVENTDTVLLVIAPQSCAQTCASLELRLHSDPLSGNAVPAFRKRCCEPGQPLVTHTFPAHAQVLEGLQVEMEVLRSRLPRKPPKPVSAFTAKARWAV